MGDELRADFDALRAVASKAEGHFQTYQAAHSRAKAARDGEGEWWGHGEEGEKFANGSGGNGYVPAKASGDESAGHLAEAVKAYGEGVGEAARGLEEQERLNRQGLSDDRA